MYYCSITKQIVIVYIIYVENRYQTYKMKTKEIIVECITPSDYTLFSCVNIIYSRIIYLTINKHNI